MWIKSLFLFVLFGCMSCVSLKQYGSYYIKDNPSILALEPYAEFKTRWGKEKNGNVTCALLRNQLLAASQLASHHTHRLWLFPLAWPFELATFMAWPITETLQANRVKEAAYTLEMAYQFEPSSFINTCHKLLQTPLGQAFLNEQIHD